MSDNEHEHDFDDEDVETTYLDVYMESPEDMIARYIEYFESHKDMSKEDLIITLGAYFNDIYALAIKRIYMQEIDAKMEFVAKMEEEYKSR